MPIAGYEYRIDGGSPVDVGNVLTIDVTGLAPQTEYDFEIRAYDESGTRSAWSQLISVTTGLPLNTYNFARPAFGTTATSTSDFSAGFVAAAVTDHYRHTRGSWGSGGAWASSGTPSVGSPEGITLDFGTTRTISEVNIVTVNDSVDATEPDLTDTFTLYGPVDYVVEGWNGSSWDNLVTVTANDKVWRQHTIAPVAISKIRFMCTDSAASFAALAEFEAIGTTDTTYSHILCEGDSLTQGVFTNTVPWPTALDTSLDSSWRVTNVALSGDGINALVADAPTQIDRQAQSTSRDILIIWIGTNDLPGAPTPASLYADIETYVAARRTAGWDGEIWLCTLIHRLDNPSYNTEIDTFNGLLIADHDFVDLLVRFDSLSEMSDPSDLTYFQADQVHINNTGAAVLAAHIESLL